VSQERPRFGEQMRESPPTNTYDSVGRFQMQPMKSTVPIAKPPMGGSGIPMNSKIKSSAPPVATFEFKTATTNYNEPNAKKGQYKPDILM